MNLLLAVSALIGGACGVFLRHLIYIYKDFYFFSMPGPTLVVNILGSFLAGLLFQKFSGSSAAHVFIITGICGGLSTMSTFAVETYVLVIDGHLALAIFNSIANVILSIVSVALGCQVYKLL
jgi:fluoride exporter